MAASSARQLGAVLRKNARLKHRSCCVTCCELFSPAIFCCILVLGFNLSSEEYIKAGLYAALSFDVAPLVDLALEVGEFDVDSNGTVDLDPDLFLDVRSEIEPVINGPLPVMPLETFVSIGDTVRDTLNEEDWDRLVRLDRYTQQFGNILTRGTLHLAPDSDEVGDFLRHARANHPSMESLTVRVHESEDAALRYVQDVAGAERTWAVISFGDLGRGALNYTIRMNYTTVPRTTFITNFIALGLDTTYLKYHHSGFLTLQALVDEYAFELAGGDAEGRPVRAPATYAVGVPMPTPPYSQNIFYQAVGFLLGLVMTMCQLYPVAQLGKVVVEEKERRLRQTMRIMGLHGGVFVTSWYVTAIVQFALDAFICAGVISLFCVNTPFWVLLLYVTTFCMGCISFALLLSVFFSNAKLAAIVLPIAFFAAVLPKYIFFGTNRFEKTREKLASSLLLPSAFSFGADILADYEYAQVGVSPANWHDGDFSFSSSIGMMLFDCALYFALFLYLDKVLPSKYGAKEHLLFLLMPSWWTGRASSRGRHSGALRATPEEGNAFERVSSDLASRESIEIVNLRKVYGSGPMAKVAVDCLNLSIYAGQITCLLGHNGAGKTTTIAVLTGLYEPTSGECLVFGHSVARATRRVYQLLGVCPQHDVLWAQLTVQEHLELYATLKGVSKAQHARAVQATMMETSLADKAHARARALSGGMKRKLSVGCALIGGSRAVLLDEPSSGMDPASRRAMWDLLQRTKVERALVLTTHYMDEADLLADRIAVMSAGRLCCVGTSLFLKSRFGLGYTLTLIKADSASPSQEISAAVQQHVPSADLLSEAGGELCFRLPFEAIGSFAGMLRHLDKVSAELGVGGYGMSMTSMEEVFLRLAQSAARDANQPQPRLNGGALVHPAAAASEAEQSTRSQSAIELQELQPVGVEGGAAGAVQFAAHHAGATLMPIAETLPAASSLAGSLGPYKAGPTPLDMGGDGTTVAARVAHQTPPSFSKQLGVLLFKRFTCMRRDKKALVSQQLLPLALIALVMMTLTIKYRPAGPAIRMHAALYAGTPTQLLHNVDEASPLMVQLDPDVVSPAYHGVADSNELSRYMLNTYNDHSRELRMGAWVHNDTLHFELYANYTKDNPAPNTSGVVSPLLNAARAVAAGTLLRCAQRASPELSLNFSINRSWIVDALNDADATQIVDVLRGDDGDDDRRRRHRRRRHRHRRHRRRHRRRRLSDDDGDDDVESSLVDRLREALNGTLSLDGDNLLEVVLLTAFEEQLDGGFGDAADAVQDLPEALTVENIVKTLPENLQGDVGLLGAEETLLDGLCDAVDESELWDGLGDDEEGGVEGEGVGGAALQDAIAPGGLSGGLAHMTINEHTLGELAVETLFVALAATVVSAADAVFPLDVADQLDALPDASPLLGNACGDLLNCGSVLSWLPDFDGEAGVELILDELELQGTIDSEQRGTMEEIIDFFDIDGDVSPRQLEEAFTRYQEQRDRLVAIDRGDSVRVEHLEGRDLPLARLLPANSPTEIDVGGGVAVGAMVMRAAEVHLMIDAVRLIGVNATAYATRERDASDRGGATTSHLEVHIDELWLNKTTLTLGPTAYVAGAERGTLDTYTYRADVDPTIEDTYIKVPVPFTLLHNSSSPHALAAFIGEASATRWRAAAQGGTRSTTSGGGFSSGGGGGDDDDDEAATTERTYAVHNHPLPLTDREELYVKLVLSVLSALFVLIPFCYIPASTAVYVVRERACKAKHLQLVSGVSAKYYWLATYCWDMSLYFCMCVCSMLIFALYGEAGYVGDAQQAAATFALLVLYGLAAIPQVYCYSFLFENHSSAQIAIMVLNLIAGFVTVIAHFVMQNLPSTRDADKALVHVYRLLPPYNFGEALLGLSATWYQNELLETTASVWDWEVAGRALLVLPAEALAYLLLLMVLEQWHDVLARLRPCLRMLCGISGGADESLHLSRASRLWLGGVGILCIILLATGSASAVVFALLLFSLALGGVLLWERRLRRVGGTIEACALVALRAAEGADFVEEADVAKERVHVRDIVAALGGQSGPSGGAPFTSTATTAATDSSASASASTSASDDDAPTLLISKLRKVYPPRGQAPPKVAVVDLSLGIPRAECFGFLGHNGAGKTTTMSILTGDYLPTSGAAWIDGLDVVSQLQLVRQRLGYCPQQDPLLDLLTGRETLVMFARLKNIDEFRIASLVDAMLRQTSLMPYADRVAGSYSGGNKRKLSLAIALIGSPSVVFLDEPSSGMDPVSRRFMWDVITAERQRRCIILTTHSMEECEALCSRIGIMSMGRLQCLGGQQHLKSKYGGGYTVEVSCDEAHAEIVRAQFPRLFPGSVLAEFHTGKFKYELPPDAASLAEIFETMEAHKGQLGVLNYSASQPSLESIFLSITASAPGSSPLHTTARASVAPQRLEALQAAQAAQAAREWQPEGLTTTTTDASREAQSV